MNDDNIYKKLIEELSILLDEKFLGKDEDVEDFLKWIKIKAGLIFNLEDIDIPKTFLPRNMTTFQYEKFKEQITEDEMKLIDSFYIKKTVNNKEQYLLDKFKEPSIEERYKLADKLIFQPKHVVWVDFGYNIGSEFSGKHPALILRNIGNNIIVVPLSSQEPEEIKDYHVKVEKVFNLPNLIRWANIHRIIPISVKRIDFHSPNGDVKREIINKISEAISKSGIN